jgi:hypothetical protein
MENKSDIKVGFYEGYVLFLISKSKAQSVDS